MAYAALISLAQTINQILNHDHSPITLPAHQEIIIISILDNAVALQSFLQDFQEKAISLEGQIRELANKAEDVVEYLLSAIKGMSNSEFELQLQEVEEKLNATARDAVDRVKNLRQRSDSSSVVSSPSRRAATSKDYVVGLFEETTYMKHRLLTGSSKLKTIPIVGMGGIGKTTFSRVVFNVSSIMKHFDIRGWVTVSRDYSVGSIALNLLASMKGISDVEREISSEDEIRQYLMGGRYLIVLDNICSKEAWDDLRILFPDVENGSRIILTTRLLDLDNCDHFYELPPLGEYDSWSLLRHTAFGDQLCPSKIEPAGRVIAARCGGLPLSIVVVGGLLSKIKKSRIWRQIAEIDGQLETIMSLSYIHLPHQLKSCFLYMAGFPENYMIRASELVKLWVAEGFIKCTEGSKSLEEDGEHCLEDLVERGLVLVNSWDFDDTIKSCSLHDMMRDFCLRQSLQEKLFVPVVDYLPTPILRRHFLPLVLKNHKRINATWNDLDLKNSMQCSHTHSIIYIPQKGYRPKSSVQNFNLLRVLHVLRRNDYWHWVPSRVFDSIYLTYLASNIPSSIVPPAISKLQNLQTLIICRSEVCLPVEIWSLSQLRHLIAFSFQPLPYPEGVALPLENLQTLSLAKDFECAEMIPNISKLGICYSEEFDGGYHDDYLRLLFRLEKLKLETHGLVWPRRSPVFPQWLKKLTLSGWRLPWVYMSMCGSLPNLQVLKLRNYACDGEHWETTKGEFVKLRLLLIDESNLQHWTTQRSHFPQLKCLMLLRCPCLSEIPKAIGYIKLIEVDDHNQSLFDSAKKIGQVRVKRF